MLAHAAFFWSGLDLDLTGVLVGVLCVALWFRAFGYLSRRIELDADLCALELIGHPGPLMAALDRLGGLHGRSRASLRHFSADARRMFLRAAALDPGVGHRLRRGLRRWTAVGLALFALGLGLDLVVLSRTWTTDRVTVDLKLGRFSAALSRAAADPDLDPELTALVRRAAEGGDGVGPETLADRARAALRDGDMDAGTDWISLAVLRGDAELAPLLEALDLASRGELGTARATVDAVGEGWSELFAPWLAEPGP
jgi:hypothetical protein